MRASRHVQHSPHRLCNSQHKSAQSVAPAHNNCVLCTVAGNVSGPRCKAVQAARVDAASTVCDTCLNSSICWASSISRCAGELILQRVLSTMADKWKEVREVVVGPPPDESKDVEGHNAQDFGAASPSSSGSTLHSFLQCAANGCVRFGALMPVIPLLTSSRMSCCRTGFDSGRFHVVYHSACSRAQFIARYDMYGTHTPLRGEHSVLRGRSAACLSATPHANALCIVCQRCQRQHATQHAWLLLADQDMGVHLARVRNNVDKYSHFQWPDVECNKRSGFKYDGPKGRFWTRIHTEGADGRYAVDPDFDKHAADPPRARSLQSPD